uniref:Peptidase A1 domain-containing protein n=1 Tax=Kalanchoe fedtschenkoi TaxID=63787 RepID=A0A7N0RA69_KALFE
MIMGRVVQAFIILSTIFICGQATDSYMPDNIIIFPLFASDGPWMYFTNVTLGSPPQQLSLLVDTGSDLLWVNCPSETSSFQLRMSYYNLSESVTGSTAPCVNGTLPCDYSIYYSDGSATSGFFVRDVLHYHASLTNSSKTALSPNVIFG